MSLLSYFLFVAMIVCQYKRLNAESTSSPSLEPTIIIISPTQLPTIVSNPIPTTKPTLIPPVPTLLPSIVNPTIIPSAPTHSPTINPTVMPSAPTDSPSINPTIIPSGPTHSPTVSPTVMPSAPTDSPSINPTIIPSAPTNSPTINPTFLPTILPSVVPSEVPTYMPSVIPTFAPSKVPTYQPSVMPTIEPTTTSPTFNPSFIPSRTPTYSPSKIPTNEPSFKPSIIPTFTPSNTPSITPTFKPSSVPTFTPTGQPSDQPTTQPTGQPSSQPSAQPTDQPTSLPTSSPSCGLGRVHTKNGIAKGQCGPCPPGTYDPFPGSPFCTACPLDTYQPLAGQSSCNVCPFPQRTESTESTSCLLFGFMVNTLTLSLVLSFVAGLFLLGLWAVSDAGEITEEQKNYWIRSRKAAVFMNLIVPVLDAITNVAYLLTQRFYRPYLFYLAVLFSFHSVIVFFHRMYRLCALPMSPYTYVQKLFVLGITTARKNQQKQFQAGILTEEDMKRRRADDFPLPTICGYVFCPISCYEHGNIFLVVWEFVGWIFAVILQIFFCVLMFLYPVFIVVWLVLGMLLQVTKVISVGRMWNVWFTVWTGDDTYTIPEDIIVDTEDFNGSQLIQFLCESIPNSMLQVFNSLLLNSLDSLAIFSMSTSGLMVLNGLYSYVYYRFFFKSEQAMGLRDIPLDKTIEIEFGILNIHINLIYARLDSKNKDFNKLIRAGHNRMIDTFWLPQSYKIHDLFDNDMFDDLEDPKDLKRYHHGDSPLASTVASSRSRMIRSNERRHNEESVDDFTFNDANQDDDGLMYGLVYAATDAFQGESEYAIDVINNRLIKTTREKNDIAAENERITRENEKLKSENLRISREKLELENMQSQAKSRIISSISNSIQRSLGITNQRYSV